jgi:acylphosphatase
LKTIQLIVSGRVQGVGFRACIRRIALDMNINGTVMNLPDGRVQIVASGEPMILEKFLSMLYGCPRALIRDIVATEINFQQFDGFFIIKGEGRVNTIL